MQRLLAFSLAALVVLTIAPAPSRADIIIQVPFVTIRIPIAPRSMSRPRLLQPGPTGQGSQTAPQVEPPPGVPLEIGPPAPPVPQVGQPAPLSLPSPPGGEGNERGSRPMTVQEFAFNFRPSVGGTYTVAVHHPFTGAPVAVTLTLPPGTPTVRIKRGLRQRVQFIYGRKQIDIVFLRNGRVRVHQ